MTSYRRARYPGGYYFFIVVTYKRREILISPLGRNSLRQAWKEVQAKNPFTTIALCLMPDHLHCIWRMPHLDCDFSSRWAGIKSRFTRLWISAGGHETDQSLSRLKKRERGVWQRRFWEHQIRDWNDLVVHVKYIHYNPVKHGFVKHPREWKWSTYSKYEKGSFYTSEILDTIQQETESIFVGE